MYTWIISNTFLYNQLIYKVGSDTAGITKRGFYLSFFCMCAISIKLLFKKLQDTTTFYTFAPMKRKILTYGGYFEAFMATLKEKEQERFNTDCSC